MLPLLQPGKGKEVEDMVKINVNGVIVTLSFDEFWKVLDRTFCRNEAVEVIDPVQPSGGSNPAFFMLIVFYLFL